MKNATSNEIEKNRPRPRSTENCDEIWSGSARAHAIIPGAWKKKEQKRRSVRCLKLSRAPFFFYNADAGRARSFDKSVTWRIMRLARFAFA